MSTRKACPCGKIPDTLHVQPDGAGKWAHVMGDCCGTWEMEFRASYAEGNELEVLANKAWNEAPRA